jgi:lysophospholipid acyltransferase (LPLAT)-like uncharacterized protein
LNERSNETVQAEAATVRRKGGGSRSQRRMTFGRKVLYKMALPVGIGIIRFFWATCRIVRVDGDEALQARLAARQPVVFCYWHRHQLIVWRYLRGLIQRGTPIGWLISASLDGEVPTAIARVLGGGIVFRGSTTSRGSEALRAICKGVRGAGVSVAATPDGPYGPRSKFKPGVIKMAQLSGVPLVPLAYAARRAWVLRTWDRFVVPRPFSRVVVAVGQPVDVPRGMSEADTEALQRRLELELESLFQRARALAD